jgi:hypothetical protein
MTSQIRIGGNVFERKNRIKLMHDNNSLVRSVMFVEFYLLKCENVFVTAY